MRPGGFWRAVASVRVMASHGGGSVERAMEGRAMVRAKSGWDLWKASHARVASSGSEVSSHEMASAAAAMARRSGESGCLATMDFHGTVLSFWENGSASGSAGMRDIQGKPEEERRLSHDEWRGEIGEAERAAATPPRAAAWRLSREVGSG
jgi:hypothetical protein